MSLENEFDNIKITKAEFRKLSQKVLGAYHSQLKYDSNTYNCDEIVEIFKKSVPDMDDDLIVSHLKKTKSYKKAHKNITKTIFRVGSALALLGIIGNGVYLFAKLGKENHDEDVSRVRFEESYQRAFTKYADYDNDGFVTDTEKDTFSENVLSGKGIKKASSFLSNDLEFANIQYLNGERVSTGTLAQWLEDYRE